MKQNLHLHSQVITQGLEEIKTRINHACTSSKSTLQILSTNLMHHSSAAISPCCTQVMARMQMCCGQMSLACLCCQCPDQGQCLTRPLLPGHQNGINHLQHRNKHIYFDYKLTYKITIVLRGFKTASSMRMVKMQN